MQESRGAAPLLLGLTLASVSLLVSGARAAERPVEPVGYARDVAPLLRRWCLDCHAGASPHGGLGLDSYAGLMRGGDSGPVVVPGDVEASLLVAKIERRHRPAMPPRRRLPPAAVRLIRAWIAAGAPG